MNGFTYSDSDTDFYSCEETHQERLERWAKLQQTTKAYHQPLETMEEQTSSESDESPSQSKHHDSVKLPNRKQTEKDASKEIEEPQVDNRFFDFFDNDRDKEERGLEEVLVGGDDNPQNDAEERFQWSESKRKQITSFLEGATVLPNYSSVCIACQTKDSSIVLEPCHHRVLCKNCAETRCPHVCPRCMIPIERRVKPSKSLFIQRNLKINS